MPGLVTVCTGLSRQFQEKSLYKYVHTSPHYLFQVHKSNTKPHYMAPGTISIQILSHQPTTQATPWSRVLLKTLIVVQLVNKFNASYGKQRLCLYVFRVVGWVVPDVSEDHSAFILTVQQSLPRPLDPWRWWHHDPSKRRNPLAQWHSDTSLKTWNFLTWRPKVRDMFRTYNEASVALVCNKAVTCISC
jgi:hypothetical protein